MKDCAGGREATRASFDLIGLPQGCEHAHLGRNDMIPLLAKRCAKNASGNEDVLWSRLHHCDVQVVQENLDLHHVQQLATLVLARW